MKPNISVLNAMMRITCGLTVVAWATSRLVRRPNRFGLLFAAMMGAMKVAEGIFRFCPVAAILKNSGISLNVDAEIRQKVGARKKERDKSSSSEDEEE